MDSNSKPSGLSRVGGLASALVIIVTVIFLLVRITNTVVWQAIEAEATDLRLARNRIAAMESAAFINEHMPEVQAFGDHLELLTYSLSQVEPRLKEGLFLEFGVYTGSTVNHIAEAVPDVTIHGFDSFEGLPETWRTGFLKGTFAMDGLPEVRDNVTLHKGWFDEVLPGFSEKHAGPIAFVHMDADLYSSTRTVFEMLADRFVSGTVIQFDEFFNYPAWQHGEYKAFMEFVEARGAQFDYIGYSLGGTRQQVSVKLKSLSPAQVTGGSEEDAAARADF